MRYEPQGELKDHLRQHNLQHVHDLDELRHAEIVAELQRSPSHAKETPEELHHRAAYKQIWEKHLDRLKDEKRRNDLSVHGRIETLEKEHEAHRWTIVILAVLALITLALLFSGKAHAQDSVTVRGATKGTTSPASATVECPDGNHCALDIVCLNGSCTGGGGGGGTSATDNTAFTAGTSIFTAGGGVFNDGLAAITSGNWATFRITAARALHINLRNSSGTEIGTLSNPIRIDPTGTTAQPVSGTVAVSNTGFNVNNTPSVNQGTSPWIVAGNVASGSADSGNPVKAGGVFNTTQPTFTNTQRGDFQISSRGELLIAKGISGFSIDNTGFNVNNFPAGFNVNNTPSVNQGTSPWIVAGNVASGSADSGNPVKVGGVFNTTQPTFTNTQRGDFQISSRGELFIAKGISGFSIDNTGFQVTNTPSVNQGTSPWIVRGDQADNSAAVNGIPDIPALAGTAYPNLTAADQVKHRSGREGLLWTANLPAIFPASFSSSATVTPAASATDIAVLPGVATANTSILLTRLKVSCTQTTAGIIVLNVIKRSTADTAGTSAAMTVVPDDSTQTGTPAAPLTYTANPTLGTTVGNVDTYKLGCMATGTASPNDIYILNRTQKPIVLRGTAQQLAVNLNAATVSGGSVAVTFEWLETTTP